MIHTISVRRSAPLLLLLGGCFPGPRPGPVAPETPDAAVYATALEALAPPGRAVVLVDTAGTFKGDVPPRLLSERLAADTALLMDLRSRLPRAVPRPLPTAREVRYIRAGELPFRPGRNPRDAWQEFNQRYPHTPGFFRVSGIAYDRGSTRAVLYVSHSCGTLCGTGWLVVMARNADAWTMEDAHVLWVS